MGLEYNIFNYMNDGVIVIDQSGSIEYINSSVTAVFGYEENYLLDKPFSMLFLDSESQYLTPLITNCPPTVEKDFLSKGKEIIGIDRKNNHIPIYIWVIKFNNTSSNKKSIVFIRKLTESEPDLIDTVVHEMISPLSAIALAVDSLSKQETDLDKNKKARLFNIAGLNIKLIIDMTEDLLLISRIENEKIFLNLTKVNLITILNTVLRQMETKLQEKNLTFKVDSIDSPIITGDKKRLAQIFRIIIDNTIKYSYPNSEILISIFESKGTRIKIKDQGIGIPKNEIPKLFTKFYRAKNASNIKGTGLGLVIAQQLVKLHNGSINIKSKVNEGSEFEIIFPAFKKGEKN